MTVRSIACGDDVFEVGGIGYDPHGVFRLGDREVEPRRQPLLVETIRASVLCNEATLRRTEAGHWVVDGDPTEGALLTVGIKAGLNLDLEREECPRTDTIPFEPEHRFMATLRHDHDGRGYIYLKGAPEQVLGMCALARAEGGDRPLDPGAWHRRIQELAQRGQRVLAGELAFPHAERDVEREARFGEYVHVDRAGLEARPVDIGIDAHVAHRERLERCALELALALRRLGQAIVDVGDFAFAHHERHPVQGLDTAVVYDDVTGLEQDGPVVSVRRVRHRAPPGRRQ